MAGTSQEAARSQAAIPQPHMHAAAELLPHRLHPRLTNVAWGRLCCRVVTFSRMRDEMVYAALRCRQPKWWVLLGLVRGRRWSEKELFYAPDEVSC